MKLYILPLVVASTLFMSSCGQHHITGHGDVKTETVGLKSTDFTRIEIDAPVDAHITVGGSASLSFEGYANLIPHIRVEVRDRTLHIYEDEVTNLHTDKNVIANITVPTLEGLELSGSSDAVVMGALNSPVFSLDASGASDVEIQEIHAKTFSAEMSGSTSLVMRSGDIADGDFDVSGAGDIKAFGVTQQQTELDLSGSADAQVTVANRLKVDISGAGSVTYKGHPQVSQDISGAGSVRAVE